MKKNTAFRFVFSLFFLFYCIHTSDAQNNKKDDKNKPILVRGIYKTSDDYTKGNLNTDYNQKAYCRKTSKWYFVTKDQEVTFSFHVPVIQEPGNSIIADDGQVYGFIDADGFAVRIVKRSEHYTAHYRILAVGKIYVYADESDAEFKSDDKGNVTGVTWHTSNESLYWDDKGKQKTRSCTEFPDVFYIAKDAAGLPIPCDEKDLTMLMSDDADIIAKVKKTGVPETKTSEWGDALNDILGIVNEYNAKHK